MRSLPTPEGFNRNTSDSSWSRHILDVWTHKENLCLIAPPYFLAAWGDVLVSRSVFSIVEWRWKLYFVPLLFPLGVESLPQSLVLAHESFSLFHATQFSWEMTHNENNKKNTRQRENERYSMQESGKEPGYWHVVVTRGWPSLSCLTTERTPKIMWSQ